MQKTIACHEPMVKNHWCKCSSVLTHLLSQHPGFGLGVNFYENRRGADQQHHQVSHAEVHQEDVGRTAHVLCLENYYRHHDVSGHADPQDHETEDHGRDPDVARDDRHLDPCASIPHALNPRKVGVQIRCRNGAVICLQFPSTGSRYGNRCVALGNWTSAALRTVCCSPLLNFLVSCPCDA